MRLLIALIAQRAFALGDALITYAENHPVPESDRACAICKGFDEEIKKNLPRYSSVKEEIKKIFPGTVIGSVKP